MIISDVKYRELMLNVEYLQSAMNNNILDIDIINETINSITSLSDLSDKKTENIATKQTSIKLKSHQVLKMFTNYIQDTYSGDKTFIHEWKPDGKLSEEQLKDILAEIKDHLNLYSSFKDATNYFLFRHPRLSGWNSDVEMIVNDFCKKYESTYPDIKATISKYKTDLECIVFANMHPASKKYDYNAKTLLAHTNLTTLYIMLYNSSKREQTEMECIEWLLKTQGYTKEYLYSEEERKLSPFLSLLYNMLEETKKYSKKSDIPYALIIEASTNCFDHALALAKKKNIVINKSVNVYFCNKYGNKIGTNISLDSNIIVDESMPILNIDFKCSNTVKLYNQHDLKIVNTD